MPGSPFGRKIDQGVVDCRIAVMIGLADHAAVDGEAAVRAAAGQREARSACRRSRGRRSDRATPPAEGRPVPLRRGTRWCTRDCRGRAGRGRLPARRSARSAMWRATRAIPRRDPRWPISNASQLIFSSSAELYPQPQLFEPATACCSWLPATKRSNPARIIVDDFVAVAAAADGIADECLDARRPSSQRRPGSFERRQVSVGSAHHGELARTIRSFAHSTFFRFGAC